MATARWTSPLPLFTQSTTLRGAGATHTEAAGVEAGIGPPTVTSTCCLATAPDLSFHQRQHHSARVITIPPSSPTSTATGKRTSRQRTAGRQRYPYCLATVPARWESPPRLAPGTILITPSPLQPEMSTATANST